MSTKIWIDDKMYLVDEPVREYVDELQAELAEAKEVLRKAQQLIEWAEQKCHVNCANGYVPMMPHGDPEPCQWCITKDCIEQALKEVKP